MDGSNGHQWREIVGWGECGEIQWVRGMEDSGEKLMG